MHQTFEAALEINLLHANQKGADHNRTFGKYLKSLIYLKLLFILFHLITESELKFLT